jgi:transposase
VTRRQLAHFIDALPAGTTVVMEACGPYVRRNSTDRTDVEGVLEANRCGGIHPVAVKRVEQQMLHRMRAQWQATRTARLKCDAGRVARMRRAPRRGARTALKRIPPVLADPTLGLPAEMSAIIALSLEDVRSLEARVAAIEMRRRSD